MVRSLVCDRLSLLAQVFSATFIAVALAMALAWRLAIVIISLQPFIIGSFYARGVLMKRMSKKVLKAQTSSSKLASEAVSNHRTIAAFSSEEKIMGLFGASLEGPKSESQAVRTFFILVTTGRVIAEAGTVTSGLSKGRDAVKSVFTILKRKSKMHPDDPEGIKPQKLDGIYTAS
ncbi:hypothetical protein IFM89_017925 [Coptis chinensis]|uniref:ABC transmembrane type-1 domain-containing protein n=1 Tax=Coptis chinensis TaxID=261450 RepID=A0A835HWB5_9MAGN|nr:hypothetical protein IFM89_017925 [Coptis chinensis]